MEAVRSCHMRCGHDHACHQVCPTGAWGRIGDQCRELDVSHSCHKECAQQETQCQFAKMKCHLNCPMAMPNSVKELKELADHVACHTECGKDAPCHNSCPDVWSSRHARCESFNKVRECHMSCGLSPDCHAQCPHMEETVAAAEKEPRNLVKDVLRVLIV
jgi:hypothetical protein